MARLEIENISKRFGKKVALDCVSCSFDKGITALLGPNGAGKSTLMNIMCTLLSADSGSVRYDGCEVKELKEKYLEKISVQFQNQPMYKSYTAEEYLRFCGELKGIPKNEIKEQGSYLLKYFGIEDCLKKKISSFSGGMKQRLALCGTFLGAPEIVFLDEPSAGLDIYEREELKNFLCELKDKCIIIISTHIVSDIENIADNIVLLGDGKISLSGSQDELISKLSGKVWELPKEEANNVGIRVYHSGGKSLCISEQKPAVRATEKSADLTDVYFSIFTER